MIVKMKKYSFLVFHRDYDSFLENIGELGVLHVAENSDSEKEESLEQDKKEIKRIDRALELINSDDDMSGDNKKTDINISVDNARELLKDIEEAVDKAGRLEEAMSEISADIDKTIPWGEYDNDDIKKLKEAGYIPRFYRCDVSRYDSSWEENSQIFPISRHGGKQYFIVLETENSSIEIDAEPVNPGENTPSTLREMYGEKKKEHSEAQEELEELRKKAVRVLPAYRSRLENDISFKEVYQETQKASEGKVMILEGWVPAESEAKVNAFLEEEEILSLATKPAEDDLPPVKLKNSRFSRLFEPISELFDLPSYNELDLTPFFAPFFMLFFGFCLGDAGYGLFFIIAAGLLKLRASKKMKPLLSLAQYFGIATILFGLLSGTFFGINLIDSGYTVTENSIKALQRSDVPAGVISGMEELQGVHFEGRAEFMEAAGKELSSSELEEYRSELLRQAEPGIPLVGSFRHLMQDPLNMFYLSLLIGALQILFGIFVKVLNVTRRNGFWHSLPTIGWLVLIISLIVYYSGIAESSASNYIFYSLFIISGLLIFVFNKPGAGIFARIGTGIWDSYGMVTGLFGDLLSYIRLFALGISSAILGFVFNDISLQLLNIPYVGWLLFFVILIAGHSINIFLATLGGFIHPMRLTFVEFYKNADFRGGGKKYEPFILNN